MMSTTTLKASSVDVGVQTEYPQRLPAPDYVLVRERSCLQRLKAHTRHMCTPDAYQARTRSTTGAHQGHAGQSRLARATTLTSLFPWSPISGVVNTSHASTLLEVARVYTTRLRHVDVIGLCRQHNLEVIEHNGVYPCSWISCNWPSFLQVSGMKTRALRLQQDLRKNIFVVKGKEHFDGFINLVPNYASLVFALCSENTLHFQTYLISLQTKLISSKRCFHSIETNVPLANENPFMDFTCP